MQEEYRQGNLFGILLNMDHVVKHFRRQPGTHLAVINQGVSQIISDHLRIATDAVRIQFDDPKFGEKTGQKATDSLQKCRGLLCGLDRWSR